MKPLYLKIENFFSHRKSEVDFSQFNSALLIGNIEGDYDISNGSGKSAVFEAILWALFNKSRAAKMDDIIMWGENECMVTFVFKHNDNKYRIIRKRNRVSSASTVHFQMEYEDAWVDISGSTSSLTNDEIIDRVRFDYKTFVNSAYFRQNDISEFAETDPGSKKRILKSIIDLSKWDLYEKDAKSNLKKVKDEVKVLEALCEGYDELVYEYEEDKEKLEELRNISKEKSSKKEELEYSIKKYKEDYEKLKKSLDTDQWDRIVGEIESLKKSIKEKKISLEEKKGPYDKNLKKRQDLEEELSLVKNSIDSIFIIDDAEVLLEKNRAEAFEFKSNITSSQERLEEITSIHLNGDSCYVCGQDLDEELSEKIKLDNEETKEKLKRKIVYSKNKIKELNNKKADLEKSIRDKRKKAELENKEKTLVVQLEIVKEHIQSLDLDIKEIERLIKKEDHSILRNEELLNSLKNDDFKNLRNKIKSLEAEYSKLSEEINNLNRDIGVYTEKVSYKKDKVSEMEKSRKELRLKIDKIDVLLKTAKIFGKNGIQAILLNAVIQDLENTTNMILSTICNEVFEIILETQRVGSDGVSVVETLDLLVKKDGVVHNFKSLSGGEQFRVSLALRIALSEISSRHGGSSLEFLLLDEVNSPLDRHGTETLFVNVIKALEDRYTMLIITHDDSLKEKFDNIIDVTKIRGESMINFISR